MSQRSRPQSTRAERLAKKRVEQREQIEEAAQELLNHFNHRNLDAVLKAVRYTLEGLRKRITASSMSSYVAGQYTLHCAFYRPRFYGIVGSCKRLSF